jgi:ABC-type nitrate/sulfonate/bicarbonate transport system substrate-binding protein
MRNRRRAINQAIALGSTAALAFGAAAAAQASTGSGKVSHTSGRAASGLPTVSIGLTGQDPIFADVILAQQLGYFKQAQVNVQLLDQEASATTNADAGRIDLVGSGTPSALPPAVQGNQTSIVYDYITGNGDAGLVVPANSKIKSVMQLAGQRVIVKGAGSGSYGAVERWSAYIQSKGGKPIQVVPVESTGAMDAEIESGEVQAGGGSLTQYTTPLVAGKVKLLVSPSSALAYSVFPRTMAGNTYWGLKSTLQAHRVGIERALSAIRKADQYIHAHSIAQISSVLDKASYLKGLSPSDIKAGVTADKPFYATQLGMISSSDWAATLSAFKNFGLTVSLSSPAVKYKSIVDMSYLQAASK